MKRPIRIGLVLSLIAPFTTMTTPLSPAPGSSAEAPLRAGAAASNITPKLGTSINGGMQDHRAQHVHDDLHARCLVLDDGETRLAIAVCDSCMLPREVTDEARRLIHAETEIPVGHILISATHAHSCGTCAAVFQSEPDAEYPHFVARRIADGVRRAVNNLAPARIAWGSGRQPDEVFNRRWRMKPGSIPPNPFGGIDQVKMNPPPGSPDLIEPAGPTDPEVSILSVRSTTGRPMALLGNYSLHYVGGTGPGHLSADYFGMFADRVQELLHADRQDPPFVGIMSNGTSGDINNIDCREPLGRHIVSPTDTPSQSFPTIIGAEPSQPAAWSRSLLDLTEPNRTGVGLFSYGHCGRTVVDFNGFEPADFDLFSIPDFAGRMGAIRTQLRPKLMALGERLQSTVEEQTGIPAFPHVAQHMRRRVNPPVETWVAFTRDRKGYKRWTHYRVAVSAAGVRVSVFVEDDADDKAQFGANLRRLAPEIRSLLNGVPALWSAPSGAEPVPQAELTQDAIRETGASLERLKTAKFQAWVPLTGEAALKMAPDRFEGWVREQIGVLKPLYLAGALPDYQPR